MFSLDILNVVYEHNESICYFHQITAVLHMLYGLSIIDLLLTPSIDRSDV